MLILASQSPRRRELLTQLGVTFESAVSDIDEKPLNNESPATLVQRLATEKAQHVFQQTAEKQVMVLGADTIVVCQGRILGKPTDKNDALRMLQLLSGQTHQVMTAVCLLTSTISDCINVISRVTFRQLSDHEMHAYWHTQEPCDKAGAYAIQGLAAQFISHLEGSYSAVMGLPLFETAHLLTKAGLPLLQQEQSV